VNAGLVPLAIATVGTSYVALVLRSWRRRDNGCSACRADRRRAGRVATTAGVYPWKNCAGAVRLGSWSSLLADLTGPGYHVGRRRSLSACPTPDEDPRMRRLVLVAMGILGAILDGAVGCGSPPPAQQPAATRTVARSTAPSSVKHPEMLATMERYLMSPFSSDDELDKIRDFVLQSPDVTIAIDELAVPFLDEDLDEGVKNLLMIGYVAGNAASQLRSGVRGDDLIAGVEGELQIYLVLKAFSTTQLKDAKVISPRLDALLALQGQGKLRTHLERAMVGRKAPTLADAGHGAAAPVQPVPARRRADAVATVSAAKDPEADLVKLIEDGVTLMKSGRAEEAITGNFGLVIARLEKQYAGEKRHIYCGHEQAEVVLYLTEAASKGEDAIALTPRAAPCGALARAQAARTSSPMRRDRRCRGWRVAHPEPRGDRRSRAGDRRTPPPAREAACATSPLARLLPRSRRPAVYPRRPCGWTHHAVRARPRGSSPPETAGERSGRSDTARSSRRSNPHKVLVRQLSRTCTTPD